MKEMGMGIETASDGIFVGLWTEDRLSTGRGPVDTQGTGGTACSSRFFFACFLLDFT